MLTQAEINEHPILDDELRAICKRLRRTATRMSDKSFTWSDFAEISLRAAARNYAATGDDVTRETVLTDQALKRAALLYAYEAIKNCESGMVSEYPELDNVLDLFRWVLLEGL